MTKAFSLFLWQNSPSVNTPLGESKLNLINTALDAVDTRVVNMDTTKANQTDLLTAVADVTYNESTGIFTVTKKNGSKTTIDTKLEKLAINFTYDSINQQLVIHLSDGTYQYVDLKALITELEFLNSDTVLFSVTNGKVSASIAKGSITADMLEPNYLANVELYASQALQSAESAEESARNAEESALRAKEEADRATSIVGGDFATNEKVDNIINGTTPVGNAKDADAVDGWHIINNPKELGFTGQLTMAQLCEKLADKQRFVWVNTRTASNGVTDAPGTYGMLTAEKRGSWCYATWIEVNRKYKVPLYVGSWHSENGWTGWNSGMITYYSLTELGLTEATATAEDIANALPDNSMLLHKLGSAATSASLKFPYNYSTLKVTKITLSYVLFECIGTGNLPIYYAYYNGGSSNKWSGWSTQYLPLTGGKLIGNVTIERETPIVILNDTASAGTARMIQTNHALAIQNVNATRDFNTRRQITLYNSNHGTYGSIAQSLKLFDIVDNKTTSYDVLHTGNSAKVTISDTAPTDGLWVVP